MAESSDMLGIIRQNLIDAGCDASLTETCMDDYQRGKKVQLNMRLKEHRKALLDDLHTKQQQIDCLDYMLYQLTKR